MAKRALDSKERPGHALSRLITNPWYGAIAGLCSIIAVPLAIFLAFSPSPKLIFYDLPVKTVVFAPDTSKRLTVMHENTPIAGSISAAQVAIWNAGELAIQGKDILDPVRIVLNPRASILETRVRQVTRDVIGFRAEVTDNDEQKGEVSVAWRILEPNDGAIIQVTYVGTTDATLSVDGVIKGQPSIHEFKHSRTARNITRRSVANFVGASLILAVFGVGGCVFGVIGIVGILKSLLTRDLPTLIGCLFFGSGGLFIGIFFGVELWRMIAAYLQRPPFEI